MGCLPSCPSAHTLHSKPIAPYIAPNMQPLCSHGGISPRYLVFSASYSFQISGALGALQVLDAGIFFLMLKIGARLGLQMNSCPEVFLVPRSLSKAKHSLEGVFYGHCEFWSHSKCSSHYSIIQLNIFLAYLFIRHFVIWGILLIGAQPIM